MPRFRMSIRDSDWLRYDHMRVIGPLRGVDAGSLQAALVALHHQMPDHPAVCRVDRAARRWTPLSADAYAHQAHAAVATHGDSSGPGTASRGTAEALRAEMAATPLGEHPIRFLARDGYVAVRATHAIGDGRTFNALVPALIEAASTNSPAKLVVERPTRLPLMRSVVRFFGRDPRRVVALLTTPRPVMPEPDPATPRRPWRSDTQSHYARSAEGQVDRLRAWRDQYMPGTSLAVLLFTAASAAFEKCGLPSEHPGMIIMIDVRRYLAKSGVVNGNFSTGPYVVPTVPGDPRSLHEALARSVDSGQPLGILAAMDLRAWRSRKHQPTEPTEVRVDPSPRLVVTHVGQLRSYAGLAWAAEPHERTMMSAPTPGGPEGITVSLAELAGVIHLNTTFHRSTFDENAVAEAARMICADPLALLHVPAPVMAARAPGAHRRR